MINIDRPVFIVGMPRSGSTALHDVLSRHPEFATTTNVTRKFPANFAMLKIIAPFYREHKPGEAGSMWDKFVAGDDDVLRAVDVTKESRSFYTKAVANVLRLYDKPRFLSKCPRNGLRMEFLAAIFPDAQFIHLIRDGRAVCQSVMDRRKRSGNINAWWDVRPEDWRQWEKLDPVSAVAHQWDSVVRAVSVMGAGMPASQYTEVRYEDFTANPVEFIQGIGRFCSTNWPRDEIVRATREIESRNDKWAKVFTGKEVEALNMIMAETLKRHGYC
jgi:omega-hydroxy-beta-dihydromenaquinone-9 sulfotransferase